MALYGERLEDTSSGLDSTITHARRTSGGADFFINTNVTAVGGILTEADFEAFIRTVTRFGGDEVYLFASPLIISVISQWAQGKLQMYPKDRTYGIAIAQYLSPHGTLNLIKDYMLENAGSVSNTALYGGYAFGLKLDEMVYRFLQNRDVTMEADIQHPGDDFVKDRQLVLVKGYLIGESPRMDNAEGNNQIVRHAKEVLFMKLKDVARLSMLIESEGSIRVCRPYKRTGENCLSSPHLGIEISNTDIGIINWAKSVFEKELEHPVKIYSVSNPNGLRTRQCYRLVISKFNDVHRILNITRKCMVGLKKSIADLICSFLNYRNTLVKDNGYVHDKEYTKAFNSLIKKVDKINRTYDLIIPVETVHSPDLNDQKTQSELNGNIKKSTEMFDSSEKTATNCNTSAKSDLNSTTKKSTGC
jgi:hypothetical protein